MNIEIQIEPIGQVKIKDENYIVQINPEYIDALENIKGFSHLQIISWGHLCDNPGKRSKLILENLFKKGPGKVGVFATRSPIRPNPILISTIKVESIDYQEGIISAPYIDIENKTPVLDIKPYFLMERVKNCKVPNWCRHWPNWYEDMKSFEWRDEINF